MFGLTGSTSAQTKNQLYLLGFNIGLADFQASATTYFAQSQDKSCADQAWGLVLHSAQDSYILIRDQINPGSTIKPFLDLEFLKRTIFDPELRQEGLEAVSLDRTVDVALRQNAFIQTVRDTYSAKLASYSKWNTASIGLRHAYLLGLHIAFAEGYSTLGDEKRQIVYSSLVTAKVDAEALGLDLTELNECILLTNGTKPMDEIHQKIVSLRTKYQGLL